MDRQADLAADLFLLNRVITAIGQDNSSTHTCKAVQLKIPDVQLFLNPQPRG